MIRLWKIGLVAWAVALSVETWTLCVVRSAPAATATDPALEPEATTPEVTDLAADRPQESPPKNTAPAVPTPTLTDFESATESVPVLSDVAAPLTEKAVETSEAELTVPETVVPVLETEAFEANPFEDTTPAEAFEADGLIVSPPDHEGTPPASAKPSSVTVGRTTSVPQVVIHSGNQGVSTSVPLNRGRAAQSPIVIIIHAAGSPAPSQAVPVADAPLVLGNHPGMRPRSTIADEVSSAYQLGLEAGFETERIQVARKPDGVYRDQQRPVLDDPLWQYLANSVFSSRTNIPVESSTIQWPTCFTEVLPVTVAESTAAVAPLRSTSRSAIKPESAHSSEERARQLIFERASQRARDRQYRLESRRWTGYNPHRPSRVIPATPGYQPQWPTSGAYASHR